MNKTVIAILLGSLVISAFFIRLENFKGAEARSIDEMVYYSLARQMKHDLSGYNTIPYARHLTQQGRELPPYFFEPLFKHPPLYSLMVSGAMYVVGENLTAGAVVSILCSILMIPLVYILGSTVYDRRVGLIAAFLMWMDPVNIITSQKVWMDTTIAFFVCLSLTLFVLALKQRQDSLFIYSAVASGLATNAKYTGFLITIAFACYALIYRRDLFKNKSFLFSLVLPLILLLPWVAWNFSVYGAGMFSAQGSLHPDVVDFGHAMLGKLGFLLPLFLILIAGFFLIKKLGKDLKRPKQENLTKPSGKGHRISAVLITALLAGFFAKEIVKALNLQIFPDVSWRLGYFAQEPPWFYFGQLIEFSFIYFFAYMALFTYQSKEPEEAPVLRFGIIVLLLFFIAYGNYQSRYILSVTPFLLVLASRQILELADYFKTLSPPALSSTMRVGLTTFIGYVVIKVFLLNYFLSFPHDFCYY